MAELKQILDGLRKGMRDAVVAITGRRGMTAVVVGVLLVAVAWFGERDSTWGFPLLGAGAALIGFGLIGPRLSGSLSLRWGEDGAFLELSSTVAPPGQRRGAPALDPGEPAGGDDQRPAPLIPPTEVEGSAETIEISVAAVEAALEARSGPDRTARPATDQKIS